MKKFDFKKYRGSCFNQMDTMSTSCRLRSWWTCLGIFVDQDKVFDTINDFNIQDYIPKYQRSNDKWSMDMKEKFISNLLKGVKTSIILVRYNEHEDAMILDGQQRLTAIQDFMLDKILVDGFKYSEIKEDVKKLSINFGFHILTAKDEQEAIQFYIDMNENITHSKEDINKAKKLLNR